MSERKSRDWIMFKYSVPITEHCLYVLIGNMSLEDVRTYISTILKPEVELMVSQQCSTYVPDCRFIINYTSQKYCFVWVTSKEVFRLLVGRDYKGTHITESTTSGTENKLVGLTPRNLFDIDWSETEPIVHEFKKFKAPLWKGSPAPIFEPAKVKRIGVGYKEGSLFCKTKLPTNYSETELIRIFSPFNTQGALTVAKTANGNAFINFTYVDDAYFALCMTKKYYDKEAELELSFDYAYKREKSKIN